jgi:hypothetical protein
VRYWSISPGLPITPRVSVCGGSWGGPDVVPEDPGVPDVVPENPGDPDGEADRLEGLAASEDAEESQAARSADVRRPVVRSARAARSGYRPDLTRTPKP